MMSIDEFAERIKSMTIDELEEELEILQENLEDIQIERRQIFGKTAAHLNAKKFEKYRRSFDREILLLEKKISLVKGFLDAGERK
ncbi:MAG: hypothetical protein QME63_00975 [Actinomycetota bacterium]|nr:hypothetical protein [Actinomycetota bacterium]